MSCFDVKILDPNINTIEIETCIGDQPSSIDIVTYDNISTVEINHCVTLLPSELSDLITVKDILSGSGILVESSSGIYTITLSNPTIAATGIVDLLEAVQDIIGNSGLLDGNYITINYNDSTGYTTISATGLQPSGNYSLVGHNHISSDITNFNSSVSGLLPVKNISAGSGIGIVSSSGDFTVSVTGTFGLTSEQVDDRVSSLLVAGNYIDLDYNDSLDSLTISVTGLQPSGEYANSVHSHGNITSSGTIGSISGNILVTTSNGLIVPVAQIDGSQILITSDNNTSTLINTAADFLFQLNDDIVDAQETLELWYNFISFVNYPPKIWEPNTSYVRSATIVDFVIYDGKVYATSETHNSGAIFDSSKYVLIGPWINHIHGNISSSGTIGSASGLLVTTGENGILITSSEISSNYISDFDSAVSGLLPNSYDAAVPWTTNHTLVDGTRYLVNDLVYESGRLYKANYDNESIPVTNTLYWTDVGPGYRLNIDGRDIPNIPYPTISNSANNRILTSTDSSTEINAESNLIFDGYTLNVIKPIAATSGGFINAQGSISIWDGNINNPLLNIFNESSMSVELNGSGLLFADTTQFQVYSPLFVNDIAVSMSGHTHTSSDITNFNSSVSGLLPVKNISAGSGIGVSNSSGDYTVSVTGTFGLTSEEVDDRISNLLVAGNYINLNYNDLANTLTISTTGLQPSGNYANSVHSHGNISSSGTIGSISGNILVTTNNGLITTTNEISGNNIRLRYLGQPDATIEDAAALFLIQIQDDGINNAIADQGGILSSTVTDFNLSVSGLIPVKNILAGSGIGISNSSGNFTVSVTGTFGLTSEEVDDRVSNLLVAGSYINLNYNDLANTLTVSTTGLQPSGNYSLVGHNHVYTDITNWASGVYSVVSTLLVAGTGISLVEDTLNDTLTIATTGVSYSGHTHILNEISNISGNRGDISVSNSGTTWLLNNNVINTQHLNSEIIIDCGLLSAPITDPYFSQVNLLTHFNDSNNSINFIDSSSFNRNLIRTGSNAVISTSQSKFGGSSLYLGSTIGDHYLTSDNITVGIQDYVIEGWFYFNLLTGLNRALFGWSTDNLYISSLSDKLVLTVGEADNTSGLTTLLANTWHHIALVRRYNTDITIYCDGIATLTVTSNLWGRNNNMGSVPVIIGGGSTWYKDKNFYIDDFRVTVGQARYTGNFIIPTTQFEDS
jgi:hypothetical protein